MSETPLPVARLAYAAFESPDVARMTAYYEEIIGLRVIEGDDRSTYLSAGEALPAIVLKPAREARLTHVALVLAPGCSAADALAGLESHGGDGLQATDPEPGVAERVELVDADGQGLRLLVQAEPVTAPERPDRPTGIAPEKLGHVARRVDDVQSVVGFYERVLGFRVSDWIGDFFAFMRCNADHHSVNFIRSPQPGGLDHLAFQLHDLAHIGRSCDLLARHGIPLIWGPGRHGAGHNLFAYFRDPDDHIVELFAEIDLMLDERLGHFDPRPWHEDQPQRPKVWDPADGANSWGIALPEEMLR